MRIGIPLSGCDLGKSGISRYLIEILKSLALLPGEEEYILFGTQEAGDVFMPHSPRFSFIPIDEKVTRPLPNVLWNATHLRGFCRRNRIDVLFFPAANRRLPLLAGVPTVGTVHDLSSLHMKGKYPLSHEIYIKGLVPGLIRGLDKVISISGATKDDLVRTARVDPSRISVIFHGVDLARFSPVAAAADAGAVVERLGLRKPYFLFISRIEHPGKNHVRLIRAFADFKARTGAPHSLILAGADWDRAELVHKAASECVAADFIRFTGFVANEDLMGLYGGAEALFFPSLFEGFGMPILEAMAAGVPVFCSDRSSLPEVGGDAAVYFDPENEADIEAKLEMAAGDPGLLGSLRTRGFARTANSGWEQTARLTLDLILDAARRGKK